MAAAQAPPDAAMWQPGAPAQPMAAQRPLPGPIPPGKPFRGRLPPHYSQVVTEEQRQRIYAIQKEYAARIDLLKAQLAALETERDARVGSVLSPLQRQRVEWFKRQSQSKQSGVPTGGPLPAGP
jgi:hypothetical protein